MSEKEKIKCPKILCGIGLHKWSGWANDYSDLFIRVCLRKECDHSQEKFFTEEVDRDE